MAYCILLLFYFALYFPKFVSGTMKVKDLTQYPNRLQPMTSVDINCTALADANSKTGQLEFKYKPTHSNTITSMVSIGVNGRLILGNFTDQNLDRFERLKFQLLNSTQSNALELTYTLRILHLSADVDGMYYCGDNQTRIEVDDHRLFHPSGSNVEIICDGAAELMTLNQLGDVVWLFQESEGQPSREIARFKPSKATSEIFGNPEKYSVTYDKLTVHSVQTADEGHYSCNSSVVAGNETQLNFTFLTILYVKVPPQPPGLPVLVSSSSSSLFVSWNASRESLSSPVSNYTLQYITLHTYRQAGSQWHETLLVNKTDVGRNTSYNITALQPSTHYVVRVIAWNDQGASLGPTNDNITETNETIPPGPRVVRFDAHTYSIKIEWVMPPEARKIKEFKLTLYDREVSQTHIFLNVSIPVNTTSSANLKYEYNVTGLQANHKYCGEIQALNSAGYSLPDVCMQVTTDIGPPQMPIIDSLTVLDLANDTGSVAILFQPPSCIFHSSSCLTSYKLHGIAVNCTEDCLVEKDIELSAVAENGLQRSYTVMGLRLGYAYEMQLAGVVKTPLGGLYQSDYSPKVITPLLKGYSAGDGDHSIPETSTAPPTTEEMPPTHTESDSKTVVIAIVVVTVLVVAITVVVIVSICVIKKKRESSMNIEQEDDLWIDLNTPLLGPLSAGYVENDYENIGIEAWAEHVKTMHSNSDIKFTEEYESICKYSSQTSNQDHTWKDSLEPANLPKNRYNNIVSYDHTRVVLKTVPGVVHSDYINANFIDSYDRSKAFIATQGPLPNTINDFWRMVWENNVAVIVMITNIYEKHKKKCEQYWPNDGECNYGKLTVTLLNEEELAYWTVRKFTVRNNQVSKKKHQTEKVIVQYHYTDWPDHGVPEYTLPVIAFVKKACSANPLNAGPIVVHCSAGVGRTGTFIVLESMMKQIMQKRVVNVQGFLRHIRSQRNHLVQNEDQYIFIHDALLHFVESGGRTDIPPKKFRTMVDELDSNFDASGETVLAKQYKTIVKWQPAEWLLQTPLQYTSEKKNRSDRFIPLDNPSRVRLPKIPGQNGSDYINATYLQGYFLNEEFIITQHPSSKTEYDFWRMVWDQNSMTIVMLSNIGEEDLVAFYRPKGESSQWEHDSIFKLTCNNEDLENIDYTIRDFMLESKQDDYEMVSRMFSITHWPEAYFGAQSYKDGVFQFIEVVNSWHNSKRSNAGPVIVIDKYGGKVAAQFCALYTLFNQFHNDATIDIYSLAYLYHQKRPGVWETQDDYKLLYTCMMQLCDPKAEEKVELNLSTDKVDYLQASTFANVRRINSVSRSPELIPRVETL